jgi:hypothetical protein
MNIRNNVEVWAGFGWLGTGKHGNEHVQHMGKEVKNGTESKNTQ